MDHSSYHHTIEDIEEHTGLSIHFINRCSSKMAALLDPFRTYGENNKLLYNDSGLVLWDRIKQWKEGGHNLTEIRAALEDALQNGLQSDREASQTDPQNRKPDGEGETPTTSSEDRPSDALIQYLETRIEELKQEKEEQKSQHEHRVEELKDVYEKQLYYLTDGKSPEERKAEREKLLREQIEKEHTIKELREKYARDRERIQRRQHRRQELIKELESLGWFDGNRRKEIYRELKQLEQQE